VTDDGQLIANPANLLSGIFSTIARLGHQQFMAIAGLTQLSSAIAELNPAVAIARTEDKAVTWR
jgi:hypothetical protein